MKKEFDNYIFDLYGTLIDIHTDEGRPQLWTATADYLKKHFGIRYSGPELKNRYSELCTQEEKKLAAENGASFPEIRIEKVWKRLIEEKKRRFLFFNLNAPKVCEDSKEIRRLCIFFRETSRDKLKVYEGVKETLNTLKSRGKGIYLLSNAQRAFTEKELEDAGLTSFFDDIFISSDKGIKKPQKEFLEQLLKENSLTFDKCVMIGNDLFSDVGVAVNNGVSSVFLNTYNYSEKRIDRELAELGIKGSELMPVIIEDGDFRKITAN